MSDPFAFAPGTVAVVTGASRGIGRSAAIALAAAGCDVAVGFTADADGAETTAEAVRAHGRRAVTIRADVRQESEVVALFAAVRAELGPAAVLVANAGVTADGYVAAMGADKWSTVIDTNLTGAFYTAREGVKQMYRRGGAIVLVASTSGVAGRAGQANYAASKGGLIALGKSLAAELAPRGIRVNVVAPGFIDTDMVAGMPPAARTEATAGIPLGRIGSPDDVAAAVTFLAGPGAGYITGKVLTVDGGLVNG
ncbi:beta-ketoacyl-ACP reductase [Tsukamurella pulmonis]|uniref:3-oxoacyl-[acyl-carrier-protein] reductase MabA n=1 Tax=Tsukamurella pulmonis TaxID=47312 RepID=A0A1H1CCT7_9ACTN|nr:3-oxoacyl-ACP reductase FabG [Tsukamurella pulmonis]KXO89959.1 beta-ketoacyl-ACP reductase [Tsukamurella pulmonis]RDH13196.1 SDR family oxidoreductase [Tsukamurella pulmonis]SDQ61984.1 3-oxoacyl-[acyl-carrier-protein] reductase [Tsukamurella pulmonis]SUP23873.1 3-oxoacyl-[acyl-carrier-protein] reductase FabG [Tsukamurella pulmonis]BDD84019.1 beta-ketoacyl-ACP reductase [Tsukamurella pulmonis]